MARSIRPRLIHRCTVTPRTEDNSSGEPLETDGTATKKVPCLIQEKKGTLRRTQAGEGIEYDAVGFFLPNAPLDNPDRLTLPSKIELTKHPISAHVGRKYIVIETADESGQGHHLVAYLRRFPR